MKEKFEEKGKITEGEGKEAKTTAPPSQKKTLIISLAAIIALILIVVVVYFLVSYQKRKAGESKIKSMEKLVMKVDKLEREINEKQKEVFDLLKKAKEQGLDIPQQIFEKMELTEEEMALLERKLEQEQDVSYKSLLKDVLEKQKEIDQLKQQVIELEKKLPRPVVVKPGDTHYEIAFNFLTKEKGLSEKEAKKLIERVNIFEYLLPGFKVWNFYADGVYGTFVTQGTAPISPNALYRKKKKELIDAKKAAEQKAQTLEQEKKTLEEQVAELESLKAKLQQEVMALQEEKEKLMQRAEELARFSEELESKLNSIYYVVGTSKQLKKMGIIEQKFLSSKKIKSLREELFPNRLDLRESTLIVLNSADYGLKKFRKVEVLPKTFKKKKDYIVTFSPDKKQVQIQILTPENFKMAKIVIIVR